MLQQCQPRWAVPLFPDHRQRVPHTNRCHTEDMRDWEPLPQHTATSATAFGSARRRQNRAYEAYRLVGRRGAPSLFTNTLH